MEGYDCGQIGTCQQYEIDRTLKASVFQDAGSSEPSPDLFAYGDVIFTQQGLDNETGEMEKFWIFYTTVWHYPDAPAEGIDAWFSTTAGNNNFEPGRGYYISTRQSLWIKWIDTNDS